MSASEDFWQFVCSQAHYLYLLLLLVTVMGLLNLVSMVVADQPEGAFVVSVLVFVVLGMTGFGVAFVLWRCNSR